MKYYLYCDEFCLTLLKERKLPFRRVDQLADPFIYSARLFEDEQSQLGISDAEYDAELRRQYAALPDSVAGLVAFDYFKEQAALRRHRIEEDLKSRQRPRGLMIPPEKQKAFAVMSIHTQPDNPVLWQKIGHSGVVLELDGSSDYFSSRGFEGKPQQFGAVQYGEQRPLTVSGQHFTQVIFSRAACFSIEEEWRMLRPVTVASKTVVHQGTEYLLMKAPIPVFCRVILGAQVSDAFSQKLQTLLQTDIRLRSLGLAKVTVDPYVYQLHIESL